MGKFLNGLFIGIGIGLFIAPQTGEETRRMLRERIGTLSRSMLSEDERRLSIDTHAPQAPSFSAQPATEFFSEPGVYETTSVPVAQPTAEFFSEPEVQAMPNTRARQPATEFFDKPQLRETGNVPVSQPAAEFFSGPEAQGMTMSSDDDPATLGDQNADVTDDTSEVADTAPMPDLATDSDQLTSTETPRTDPAAITEALPPLSSPTGTPSRTARRKPSTKTPNTSKTRGHNRS